jgi:3-phenylpropionate/trans-cinnamate dioxygenase ferredoxin reductase subunit
VSDPIVIVGAGQAAASAAHTLRGEGYDGGIVILGEEAHLPYQRPPLSKELLLGTKDADATAILPADWYERSEVEVRRGVRVSRVVPSTRAVELEDGTSLVASGVLLATGGRPRRIPGWDGERVLYLRDLTDAAAISSHLGEGHRLVVVGAGFIGSEVAASARRRGTDVTLVEALPQPLARVLDEELGALIAHTHRREGVDVRLGVGVASVTETGEGVLVELADGARLEADAVVVGVGLVPNVEVAEASGLEVDDGVVVDDHARTSVESVYAAGDVARHHHPLFQRQLRVEHFDNAIKQGAVAARNLLGEDVVFDDPHWFWSDQYDHSLQYVGDHAPHDQRIVRGELSAPLSGDADPPAVTVFWLRGGVLRAAFAFDRGRDVRVAQRLVSMRARPDPRVLADPDTDLRDLL